MEDDIIEQIKKEADDKVKSGPPPKSGPTLTRVEY